MKQYLTKEGLEKIKNELDYLKNVKRKEIAEKLKHAISFGDLKENAAYDEAKEAQAFLEGRIGELSSIIRDSAVTKEISKDKVGAGCTVYIVKGVKEKEPAEVFRIVGSSVEAESLKGIISVDSPLGKAMLNLKKGDKFSVDTPEGKIKYKILKID